MNQQWLHPVSLKHIPTVQNKAQEAEQDFSQGSYRESLYEIKTHDSFYDQLLVQRKQLLRYGHTYWRLKPWIGLKSQQVKCS